MPSAEPALTGLPCRVQINGSRIDTVGSRIDAVHVDLQETNSRLGKVELKLERVEVAIVRMSKVNDAVLDEQFKDSGKLEALEGRVLSSLSRSN